MFFGFLINGKKVAGDDDDDAIYYVVGCNRAQYTLSPTIMAHANVNLVHAQVETTMRLLTPLTFSLFTLTRRFIKS